MSLESYIRAVPKAELHVHLTGTIRPSTLESLGERHGLDLQALPVEELRRGFVFHDFEHFRRIYRACSACLLTSEDYEFVVCEFGQELARQNVRYAEVAFGPTTPYFRHIPQQTYMDGLNRGRRSVKAHLGVEINWVFELGRGPDQAAHTWDYTTQVAIEGRNDGVIALGLAGPEYRHPNERFAPWFKRARRAGLHSVPHAGEMMGPPSVWSALHALGAERLGHGVRAIEDPMLVSHLAAQGIPLELCPRSNVCLGLYDRLEDHPLPRLYDAGVRVTVNSDDPPFFGTSLTDELLTLVTPFGLNATAIDEIVLNPVRHSFLAPQRKRELEAEFRSEMDLLKEHHLGKTHASGQLEADRSDHRPSG